jgi:FSR family fosmidomycin resistance protein-like MFS transporter
VIPWITWTHFLNDGLANYLPGILPFVLMTTHIPVTWAGTLMTALGLGQGLQPLSGWLADQVGGRTLILGGVALSTTAAALIGLGHPLWLLLCLLFFTGIGNTAFHPQALSLMRQQLGQRPGIALSVFLVGGEIGRSLGPLVAGLVVHQWGLDWVWVMALPLVLTYPWIVRAIPPQKPRRHAGLPLHLRRHALPALFLLMFALVRSGSLYEISTVAPLIWHQQGGSMVAGASLVTVLIGVGLIGNLLGGTLHDRWGGRTVVLASSALTVLAMLGFIRLHGFWEWPVLGAMGVGLFAASSTTLLIGQHIFSDNPGLGSGIALGLANALGAILAFPLTYLAETLGYQAAVWILMGLVAATTPLIFWLPRSRPIRT